MLFSLVTQNCLHLDTKRQSSRQNLILPKGTDRKAKSGLAAAGKANQLVRKTKTSVKGVDTGVDLTHSGGVAGMPAR